MAYCLRRQYLGCCYLKRLTYWRFAPTLRDAATSIAAPPYSGRALAEAPPLRPCRCSSRAWGPSADPVGGKLRLSVIDAPPFMSQGATSCAVLTALRLPGMMCGAELHVDADRHNCIRALFSRCNAVSDDAHVSLAYTELDWATGVRHGSRPPRKARVDPGIRERAS